MTAEDYLSWEDAQTEKHEFVAGQVRALGAIEIWPDLTAERDLLVRRLGLLLDERVGDRYTVNIQTGNNRHTAEIKVCRDGIPHLVVEITTPQEALQGHGVGVLRYQEQTEVTEILQIALAQRRGDLYQRHGDRANQWLIRSFGSGDAVTLASINVSISGDDLFAGLGPAPVPRYLPADSAP